MTARLTDSALGRLSPGDHTDPSVTGLQIRVRIGASGKRRKAWLLRYKWQGRPIRITLGGDSMSLADARGAALSARTLIERGIDPRAAGRPSQRRTLRNPTAVPDAMAAQPNDPHSVAALAHEYLERHVKRQRKRPEYVARFLNADVLTKRQHRDARTITPREVVELLDEIVERGAPTMANRGAGVLSQMFRYGVHSRNRRSTPSSVALPTGRQGEAPRVGTFRGSDHTDHLDYKGQQNHFYCRS
jgi:hypothetical protein